MARRILSGDFHRHAFYVGLGRCKRDAGLSPCVGEVDAFTLVWLNCHPDIDSQSRRRDPRYGQMKRARHHGSDVVASAVECEPFADNPLICAKLPPKPIRNHDAGLIVKPLTKGGTDAEILHQSLRYGHSLNVMWIACERQILSGKA